MSPLGFGHRQRYLDDDSDVEYYEDEYHYGPSRSRTKPVPIWLCVLLVVSYIFGGAFLFQVSSESTLDPLIGLVLVCFSCGKVGST